MVVGLTYCMSTWIVDSELTELSTCSLGQETKWSGAISLEFFCWLSTELGEC